MQMGVHNSGGDSRGNLRGTPACFPRTVTQPTLQGLDKLGGGVEVSFNLLTSDGVNIYSQRDGDPEFKLLSRETHSPCVDNRPLLVPGKPELRQYRAIFVVGDQEVSQFSDDITVNCAPPV
jgi:hypothetical protein